MTGRGPPVQIAEKEIADIPGVNIDRAVLNTPGLAGGNSAFIGRLRQRGEKAGQGVARIKGAQPLRRGLGQQAARRQRQLFDYSRAG